ncbi:MAG: GNAT family N-acetyltransferase [Actinomycetota bacterium]
MMGKAEYRHSDVLTCLILGRTMMSEGVITVLLEDAIEKAKSEGYPRMQVTTWIGNLASKKAYEKVGFKVDKEKTHKSFEELYGSPGQVRLMLEF